MKRWYLFAQKKVQVQSIDYPKLRNPFGKPIEHGVMLKICDLKSFLTLPHRSSGGFYAIGQHE